MGSGPSRDVEAGDEIYKDFNETIIRHNFIRKVYSILTAQILVTIGIIAIFLYFKPATEWAHGNFLAYIGLFVATIIVMIFLACCEGIRRQFPLNIILLGIFTVLEGTMLGFISAHHQINQILLAMAITAVIVVALTLFAFQTKWDFTIMAAGMMIVTLLLLIFGIILLFVHMKILHLIYSCLGALVFSFWLVIDTQLMMGGNHKYSISPEDYILAVISLYTDIITIFIYILGILNRA